MNATCPPATPDTLPGPAVMGPTYPPPFFRYSDGESTCCLPNRYFGRHPPGRRLAVPAEPAAFMSYVHLDNDQYDGQLGEFRRLLATEVRAQTGQEFVIFQD